MAMISDRLLFHDWTLFISLPKVTFLAEFHKSCWILFLRRFKDEIPY